MTEMPLWEQRLRAPKMTLPVWSQTAPDRCIYATDASGIWQVHAWDVGTGETRQVSDHPVGVLEGYATIDGSGVLFWQEDTGDETGRWLVQAFEGGGAEPFLDEVPVGWNEGVSQAPGIVAAAISTDDGSFGIYVSVEGAPAKTIATSTAWTALPLEAADIAGLSADGTLLAVQHAEHGDITSIRGPARSSPSVATARRRCSPRRGLRWRVINGWLSAMSRRIANGSRSGTP
jgi:hypothetical protein